jgi:type IV pilus assembly protein PilQ
MITDYPEVIENIIDRFKEYISEEALRELGINWSALFFNARVP